MGTDAAEIRRGWKLELQGCSGDGVCFCGKPAGHLINLADDKNSGASVRILGKLSREISYVAVKYVVDSWSTVFWSCCKKRRSDAGQLRCVLPVKF